MERLMETHRTQASWLKWQGATGMICDRKFSSGSKGKFYRVAIRATFLYVTEYWPVKKTFEHKIKVDVQSHNDG